MTRFARAKGSKSCNERTPEQPTSWSDMRRELHRESIRKAAEEQIEREARQVHQTTEKNVPLKNTKEKIFEPVELASFDDIAPNKPCTSYKPVRDLTSSNPDPNRQSKAEQGSRKRFHPDSDVPDFNLDTFKNTKDIFKVKENRSSEDKTSETKLHKLPYDMDFDMKTGPSKSKKFKDHLEKNQRSRFHCIKSEEDLSSKIGGNFKGYPVPKEDAETLTDAYNILRKEGLTHKQAMERIKPERRRAEKRLARLKSMVCFRCRQIGHKLSDCPLGDTDCDVCFKCGSTTHKYQDCKKKGSFVNAKCFICGNVGHLSGQCPENSHGVYPQGGECKICGKNTHLVKDCPENKNKNEQDVGATEFDDHFDEKPSVQKKKVKKKFRNVKF